MGHVVLRFVLFIFPETISPKIIVNNEKMFEIITTHRFVIEKHVRLIVN